MYKQARKEAGFTLEDAAWRLNIAPRTLAKYEAGDLRVPPDTVCKMAELYCKPELPLLHCAQHCAIGRLYHPVIEPGNIATGTLALLKELKDVNERVHALINIAADGHISPEEAEEFEAILKELLELRDAIQRIKLLAIKKKEFRKEGQAA